MKAVVDASPLIFLAKLDALDLLPDPCVTTAEVLREIHAGGPPARAEVVSIEALQEAKRLVVARPANVKKPRLDPTLLTDSRLGAGELSVLRLALHDRIPEVILDDRLGIRVAKAIGLTPVSTAFLLLRARRESRLSAKLYEARLEGLVQRGYHLSAPLYRRLVEAGREG